MRYGTFKTITSVVTEYRRTRGAHLGASRRPEPSETPALPDPSPSFLGTSMPAPPSTAGRSQQSGLLQTIQLVRLQIRRGGWAHPCGSAYAREGRMPQKVEESFGVIEHSVLLSLYFWFSLAWLASRGCSVSGVSHACGAPHHAAFALETPVQSSSCIIRCLAGGGHESLGSRWALLPACRTPPSSPLSSRGARAVCGTPSRK